MSYTSTYLYMGKGDFVTDPHRHKNMLCFKSVPQQEQRSRKAVFPLWEAAFSAIVILEQKEKNFLFIPFLSGSLFSALRCSV